MVQVELIHYLENWSRSKINVRIILSSNLVFSCSWKAGFGIQSEDEMCKHPEACPWHSEMGLRPQAHSATCQLVGLGSHMPPGLILIGQRNK